MFTRDISFWFVIVPYGCLNVILDHSTYSWWNILNPWLHSCLSALIWTITGTPPHRGSLPSGSLFPCMFLPKWASKQTCFTFLRTFDSSIWGKLSHSPPSISIFRTSIGFCKKDMLCLTIGYLTTSFILWFPENKRYFLWN